jgi:PAS domain S-box-containing protein
MSELLRLLQAIAIAAHEMPTAEAAMQVCLDHVCAHTGWEIGHVYTLAPNRADLLVPTAIWHIDDPERFMAFREITRETPLPLGVGLPGRVLASGRATWIIDLADDPNFPRMKLGSETGVRSGFAFPVLVGSDVVAVLEFFTTSPREPDPALLEVMEYIGMQLGRAVEREKTATALRRSEERYRVLVERSKIIMWEVDLATWTFTYVSEYAEELLGYPREDWYRPGFWTERLHPEDRDWAMAFCVAATGRCEDHHFEYRMIAADGRTVWLNDVVAIVMGPDTAVQLRGVMIDVTAQRQAEQLVRESKARLEEQLRQSQKMEAIGQLAGGMAHDFNNLLTVIGGCSDVLLSTGGLNQDQQLILGEIKAAGDRAARLIRQLLAFSRRQIFQPTVLDLNRVITNLEGMLRRLLREDIELSFSLAPDLRPIKADPAQLEQVLLNLIVNARDAMPDGGKLTIETTNVLADRIFAASHTDMRPGSYILLAVSDTGCGMSDAIKAHVFEPFFTTKAPGKGTGLGLSTVYGVVRQSGGIVDVYSEPGRGTTFKIYLPAAPETVTEQEAPKIAQDLPRGDETVLLVEDDDAVRSLVSRLLHRQGYTVIEARDGEEALAAARAHAGPIHLVLSDVIMPKMGGPALAEELLRLRPALRVLYMSGYARDATLRSGVLANDVALLQKPFTHESLARRVRQALDGDESKR